MGRKINSHLTIGISGNLSFSNFSLLDKLNKQLSVGSINLMNKNDLFQKRMLLSKDINNSNTLDIIAHGSFNSIQLIHNNKAITVDWRTLSKIIKNSKDFKKQPIRLLSCNTGNQDKSKFCFAQNLANKLKVNVIAPSDYLFVNPDSTYFVSKGKFDGNRINPKSPKGSFITFHPLGGKKHE